MLIQNNNVVINCEAVDEEFVRSLDFTSISRKVGDFFGVAGIQYKVKFLYSISEFHFFSQLTFKPWHCGFTLFPNIIFVFSPSVIEKLTNHKKDQIPAIITHELSHLFYNKLRFPRIPLLDEGIATYIAFYDEHKKKIPEEIEIDISESMQYSEKIYHQGFLVIDYIMKRNKKGELFSFLNGFNSSKKDVKEELEKFLLQIGIKGIS